MNHLKLFRSVGVGFPFHYGDNPDHVCVKMNEKMAVCTHGIRKAHPDVLVFEEEPKTEAIRGWLRRPKKPK